jgi:hypothetical protein
MNNPDRRKCITLLLCAQHADVEKLTAIAA